MNIIKPKRRSKLIAIIYEAFYFIFSIHSSNRLIDQIETFSIRIIYRERKQPQAI
jgi:hypothetical protein